ncbi:MAG: rhodanese-like domain-containing protein [Solirubrobacterales bacterium]|jgi:rhodanese-related sulfurtransferase
MSEPPGAPGTADIDRRLTRREHPQQVPKPMDGSDGLFVVDGTWGKIYPMELAPGIRAVGELEVISHIKRDLPLIDTRLEHFHEASTIPGAHNIPHHEIRARLDDLEPGHPTVFFCNGPQCGATPDAIRSLLESGFPEASILYYRGGMHDWITLGLPIAPPGGGAR